MCIRDSLGGEENIYAAIKAGRVFGCVDYIHDDEEAEKLKPQLTRTDVAEYEKLAGFKYLVYPDELGKKPGFLLNVYGK